MAQRYTTLKELSLDQLVKGVGVHPDHQGTSPLRHEFGSYFFLIKYHIIPPRLVDFFRCTTLFSFLSNFLTEKSVLGTA
jgi:hypothetical protein